MRAPNKTSLTDDCLIGPQRQGKGKDRVPNRFRQGPSHLQDLSLPEFLISPFLHEW